MHPKFQTWSECGRRFIDRLTSGPGAALKVALFAWALSTLLASPAFFNWTWEGMSTGSRAADFLKLCADPLARNLNEPIMAYRLTVPTAIHFSGLEGKAAVAAPYLAHLGFLAIVFVALRRRVDPTISLWLTLVIALSFALFWSNWKPGFTDTTTHLLSACLLLVVAPHWTALALFLGLLNDERALLALPFVFLWHFPLNRPVPVIWRESRAWLVAVLGGGLAYLALRHALTVGWIGPGIEKPEVYRGIEAHANGFRPWLGSWTVWALNVFLAFRWAWALIIGFAILLLGRREWLVLALFLGALLVGCLASALVADVARSVGYLFPAWLLAGVTLARADPERARRWMAWIVVALVFTPVFFTFENFSVQWHRPLPLVILRMVTGVDAAH